MGCLNSNRAGSGNSTTEKFAFETVRSGTSEEVWNQSHCINYKVDSERDLKVVIYSCLKDYEMERNSYKLSSSSSGMETFVKQLVERLQPFLNKDATKTVSKALTNCGTNLADELKKQDDVVGKVRQEEWSLPTKGMVERLIRETNGMAFEIPGRQLSVPSTMLTTNTQKRCHPMIKVCVEGNIGSGKSTLLEGFAKAGYRVYKEPVVER